MTLPAAISPEIASPSDWEALPSAIRAAGTAALLPLPLPPRNRAITGPCPPPALLAVCPVGGRPFLLDTKSLRALPQALTSALHEALLILPDAHTALALLRHGLGMELPRRLFCVRTASWLLGAGTALSDDLPSTAARFGTPWPPEPQSPDWCGLFLSPDQLEYAALCASALAMMLEPLRRELATARLGPVFELELNILPAVLAMEATGVPASRAHLQAELKAVSKNALTHYAALQALHGAPLSPASSVQILEALHRRGIEVSDTKESTLHPHAADEFVSLLLAFRNATMRKREARALLASISKDSRIHPSLNPLGTDAGHFTSANPCLEAVASGPMRSAFAAPEGAVLVAARLNQPELRAATWLAGEQCLLEPLARGEDPLPHIQEALKDKPLSVQEHHSAALAEMVAQCVITGAPAEKLAALVRKACGVQLLPGHCEILCARFLSAFPKIAAWQQAAHTQAASPDVQEVRTPLGRRRLLPAAAPSTQSSRFTALLTHPVHGGLADALKLALLVAARSLPEGAKLCAVTHHELLAECPAPLAEQTASALRHALLHGIATAFPGLPAAADVRTGTTWP